MIKLKLPIGSSWKNSLQRWASEIRTIGFLGPNDLSWQKWEMTLSAISGTVTFKDAQAEYVQINNVVWISAAFSLTVSAGTPAVIFASMPTVVAPPTPNADAVRPYALTGLFGDPDFEGTYFPLSVVTFGAGDGNAAIQRTTGTAFVTGSIALTGVYKSG